MEMVVQWILKNYDFIAKIISIFAAIIGIFKFSPSVLNKIKNSIKNNNKTKNGNIINNQNSINSNTTIIETQIINQEKKPECDTLELAETYVNDIYGWKKIYQLKKHSSIYTAYYIKHPEFTLRYYDEIEPSEKFFEHWHLNNTIRIGRYKLGLKKVELRYHQTILKTYELINVEHQKTFPVPKYIYADVFNNPKSNISRNSIEFKIATILDIDCDINDMNRGSVKTRPQ